MMKRAKMRELYNITLRIAFGIILSGTFLVGCGGKTMHGMVILTQVSPAEFSIDAGTGGSWRYMQKSRIITVDPSDPGMAAKILTENFYSARSPVISFDGNKMLFAAQKIEGGTWQIYEMDLNHNDVRQVIETDRDCTDPAYLPDGNIIFSSINMDESPVRETTLYTCGPDGCCLNRITFHPDSEFASAMLDDGRVVTIAWQVYPEATGPEYRVIRPDGTKSELYYKGKTGTWLNGRICESDDGNIYFTESDDPAGNQGKLIALKRTRPLGSRQEISSGIDGGFYSVAAGTQGSLLVSYRKSESDHYGIYEFDPVNRKLGKALLEDDKLDCIEPVLVTARPLPKILPTEVNMEKATGFLMCQNTDLSTLPVNNLSVKDRKTKSVRIMGLHGLVKEIPVEEDGSFFVDITSDEPFRFLTVNASGEILRGPSAWMWMRPNERRGCVGCHESRERAPENRVAQAIKKVPVEVVVPGSRHEEEGSKGLEKN